MKYYVMNVFNNWENKVKEQIEKELEIRNLSKLLGRVIIPKEKVFVIRKEKKIKTERSFFPGYMMIECEMTGELSKIIRNINGVVSFLGGENPSPMKEHEVKELLMKVDELEESQSVTYDHLFKIGQKIKIIDGFNQCF